MAKVKIIDIAKKAKLKAPSLVETAKGMGLDVRNALSYVDEKHEQDIIDKTPKNPSTMSRSAMQNKKGPNRGFKRNFNKDAKPGEEGANSNPNYRGRNTQGPNNQSGPNPNYRGRNTQGPNNQSGPNPNYRGRNTQGPNNQSGPNSNYRGRNNNAGGNANGARPNTFGQATTPARPSNNFNNKPGAFGNPNATKKTQKKKKQVVVNSKFSDNLDVLKNNPKKEKKVIEVAKVLELYQGQDLTVSELADKIHVPSSDIIKQLFLLGVMATQTQVLEREAIEIVCEEYEIEIKEVVVVDETDINTYDVEDDETKLVKRPPVITIMGHVDHGKTSLLDAIRKTKITSGEAGGITQHIGAYQITHNNEPITFIDTPGHAAFSAMRARGSQITDIVILVVAADDSVMPQTIEAIDHAKAAGVPIIVAVNKIDKPEANPERVMTDLSEKDLVPEIWGGKTIYVNTSAQSGEGIDDLLEMIILESEMLELKADPNRLAMGTVIEARVEQGRGVVASILVEKGTLQARDSIVAGHSYGKVRTVLDDLGKNVKKAGPSMPVEITGLNDVPDAGEKFMIFENDKKAREVSTKIDQKRNESRLREQAKVSVDSLFEKISEQELKEINIIVKTDVKGSAEALNNMLSKLQVGDVRVKVIRSEVGTISESDVILSSASDAIIIGFNVRPTSQVREVAKREGVDIRLHSIVYKVAEELEDAMNGMLEPEFEEKVMGSGEVRSIFKASKVGSIAGVMVMDGIIKRNSKVRLLRDGVVIVDGELGSLKRFKDDVKEVRAGFDCGLTVDNFNDVKEGDIIEAYEMVQV